MTWLIDCGLIYKISRVTKPDMPLMAYQDFNAFKLYILDVGLLGAMSDLDLKSLLDGNNLFVAFKGALTEQYVLQQLIASRKVTPYYLSLIHISEPTRLGMISYAVFCLKKKKTN